MVVARLVSSPTLFPRTTTSLTALSSSAISLDSLANAMLRTRPPLPCTRRLTLLPSTALVLRTTATVTALPLVSPALLQFSTLIRTLFTPTVCFQAPLQYVCVYMLMFRSLPSNLLWMLEYQSWPLYHEGSCIVFILWLWFHFDSVQHSNVDLDRCQGSDAEASFLLEKRGFADVCDCLCFVSSNKGDDSFLACKFSSYQSLQFRYAFSSSPCVQPCS